MHTGPQRSDTRFGVVSADDPAHPRHGGQLETRNRIEALARYASVRVIAYSDDVGVPTESRLIVAEGSVALLRLPRRALASSVMRPFLPLQWARRLPSARSMAAARQFFNDGAVDAVVCDSLFAWPLVRRLTDHRSTATLLREHNVEGDYIRELGKSAKPPTSWLYYLDSLRTARAERLVCRAVGNGNVLAVTADDAVRLEQLTGVRCRVLPSFAGQIVPARNGAAIRSSVLYAGNLYMPNNVAGVRWFATSVWPLVLADCPSARLTVAGSRPSTALLEVLRKTPGVELVTNPADLTLLYGAAACAVNPCLHGAGMHMKNLDALRHGVPVVSTVVGSKGFPEGALFVGHDAREFAEHVIELVKLGSPAQQSCDDAARRLILDDELKARKLIEWAGN